MDGTVLVADDDRTIRTVLTQALTRAGCKVHATSSMVTLMRWVEEGKFWPAVARIDNTWGDRNLFCACPPVEEVAAAAPPEP